MMWSTKSVLVNYSIQYDVWSERTLHDLNVPLFCCLEPLRQKECDCAPFLEGLSLEWVGCILEGITKVLRLVIVPCSAQRIGSLAKQ